jgi:hypothetical protein
MARHFLPEGEGKERVIRSQFASELHHLPGPHALVGGEDDAQRVDRIFEMLAKIDLATDRLEEQALLALAELLMAGLVLVDSISSGCAKEPSALSPA